MTEPLLNAEGMEPTLANLRGLRSIARSVFRQEVGALRDYTRTYSDRTVIARTAHDDTEPNHNQHDPAGQSTCTCFVATHMAGPLGAGTPLANILPAAIPDSRAFAGEKTINIMQTILADFARQYRIGEDGSPRATSDAENAKDAASLPNFYNTPIHLCGVAASVDYVGGLSAVPRQVFETALALGANMAKALLQHGGFVYDLDLAHTRRPPGTPPNPYLSYWCVRSLVAWSALVNRTNQHNAEPVEGTSDYMSIATEALTSSLEACLDRLSRMIAAYHAGIGSLYDAVDLVCGLASVGLASSYLGKKDEFTSGILSHAIGILLGAYVHSDGSFAPKSVVLTTRGGYSIVASSTELAAILLHGTFSELSPHHLPQFERVMMNARRRRDGPRGWGSGAGRSTLRRPAFAACGALAFLRDYYLALDKEIAAICARELGVQPYAPDPQVDSFKFPLSVRDGLVDRVIRPIKEQKRADLAAMSFVLGGPPGAAKTTIARKIAAELGWPVLTLEQGSFLRKGAAQVESEAERIFDFLLELSETVVLFDEFEGMVEIRDGGERAGRFLTTSMLPRIHRLRDQARVIFIVATNHPERIDPAASRPGRIDAIFNVQPPSKDERQHILESLYRKFGASSSLRQLFKDAGVAGQTDGFTWGYLNELVKSCVSHERANGIIEDERVSEVLTGMRVRIRGEWSNGGGKNR